MTKRKKTKKVVVTRQKLKPTTSKARTPAKPKEKVELPFGKKNYILMLAGIVLIILGLALMAGGKMPSPDVWDESLIYSPRRITLAPIAILAGLVIQVFAIFKD